MDWLEQELKGALSRKDPPADFASRVVRQAERRPERPVYQWPRWLAAAAAVIVMAGAGLEYRQYRGEMARGELAKEQLMQAFKIASVKVNRIQTEVQRVGK